mmetsp:Transcript_9443/g.28440  ORF Transcript_9443/g.28440 Transcript_9443/m.28440 type:complete len:325 (+) Transcript_9443:67-1041(+)
MATCPAQMGPCQNILAGAAETLRLDGFVRVELGANTPIRALESTARQLMGLGQEDGGGYNGGGGVTRNTVESSGFLNGSAGSPPELKVQFHNEMAYSPDVPRHLAFAMLRQAGEGGANIIADNIKVTSMLSEKLKQKLQTLGVRYIRNLSDESERGAADFFNCWQDAFQTKDIDEALEKGNTQLSMLRRLPGSERLQHVVWSTVFNEHPEHGELYFSSILNRHGSWLDGHNVFGLVPLQERPYHCVWGDGTEFSEEELGELRDVHEKCTTYVLLQQGDLLVMDNLRVAHGRMPFVGDRLLGLLLSDKVHRDYQAPAAFRVLQEE